MNRFQWEKQIIAPVVEEHFKAQGFQTYDEVNLTLTGCDKVSTRHRRISIDLLAKKDGKTKIIEIKAASYPQLIGSALGEILVYGHLILKNSGKLTRKGEPVDCPLDLEYCCVFPDVKLPQGKWDPRFTELFNDVSRELGAQVELYVLRWKGQVELKDWHEFGKSSSDQFKLEYLNSRAP